MTRFAYLGSTIDEKERLDPEIQLLIPSAAAAVQKLSTRVFCDGDILIATGLIVYSDPSHPPVRCAERWILYRRHVRVLECIHHRTLRKILAIG